MIWLSIFILIVFFIWLILSIIPIWHVKFRFYNSPRFIDTHGKFSAWEKSEETGGKTLWQIFFGINKNTKWQQPWLDIFRYCGNCQWKVTIF